MGDIGKERRQIEFEPLTRPVEVPEPVYVPEPSTAPSEPVKVPVGVPA